MTEADPKAFLHEREKLLAQKLPLSVTPAFVVESYLGIPRQVAGESFLDLGAGGSSLVARLLERGAKAEAVDPLYAQGEQVVTKAVARAVDYTARSVGPYADLILADSAPEVAAFLTSFQLQRDRYHAAYFTQLPFPNETFDWVVSMNGLTHVLTEPDLADAALDEAVRVTRYGGRIVICPIATDEELYGDALVEAHQSFIERTIAKGLVVAPEPAPAPYSRFDYEDQTRLTIVRI